MAKISTEIDMDKPRKMRFGYKVMREIDTTADKRKGMSELDALEFLILMSLKEDDPDLTIAGIPDILNECDLVDVKNKLHATLERDMPGLLEVEKPKEAIQTEGVEPKNEQITPVVPKPE